MTKYKATCDIFGRVFLVIITYSVEFRAFENNNLFIRLCIVFILFHFGPVVVSGSFKRFQYKPLNTHIEISAYLLAENTSIIPNSVERLNSVQKLEMMFESAN